MSISERDINLVGEMLEEIEDRIAEASEISADVDPVALCATVNIIAKMAILICSILGKPVQIDMDRIGYGTVE